jgi:hypothetical protein
MMLFLSLFNAKGLTDLSVPHNTVGTFKLRGFICALTLRVSLLTPQIIPQGISYPHQMFDFKKAKDFQLHATEALGGEKV